MKLCSSYFYDAVIFVSLLENIILFCSKCIFTFLNWILYPEFCIPFLMEGPPYWMSFRPHRTWITPGVKIVRVLKPGELEMPRRVRGGKENKDGNWNVGTYGAGGQRVAGGLARKVAAGEGGAHGTMGQGWGGRGQQGVVSRAWHPARHEERPGNWSPDPPSKGLGSFREKPVPWAKVDKEFKMSK